VEENRAVSIAAWVAVWAMSGVSVGRSSEVEVAGEVTVFTGGGGVLVGSTASV
jgi:hypothetical protein